MNITEPVQATVDGLKKLIQMGNSSDLFLSLYVPTDPADISTDGVRLRIIALLDEVSRQVSGSPREQPFFIERKVVEEFSRSIRPGGVGLAIISSQQGQEWDALSLPVPVEEHARFGAGVDVLPLMDIIDELEPVAVVMVARDRARLMVFAGGRAEKVQLVETPLPERDSTSGRVSPRLQRANLTREAGGGGAAGFERHMMTHIENHLKRVKQELESLYRGYSFHRLFLAGPTDTVAMFKRHLSHELQERLVEELEIDAHASDHEIGSRVLQAGREAERHKESELVQEIITRAEKEQDAVAGIASSLWALNRHQVHLLVLAGGTGQSGNSCSTCELLLPPEDIMCPQCDQKTQRINLWEELPGFALRRGIPVEVVHGEAASALWHYEGIGGMLKPVRH